MDSTADHHMYASSGVIEAKSAVGWPCKTVPLLEVGPPICPLLHWREEAYIQNP